jgi:phosphomannomutase
MQSLRIGTAGLRGQIATALTPPLAMDFASALGTYLDGGAVIVGRDTRISSPMLCNAAVSALLSCGCNVIDAGVISAPEMHFMVPHLKAAAGLLVSAGHHPKGWNALIPFTASGAFFTNVQLQELLDIYHSRRYSQQPWDRIGTEKPAPARVQEDYLDRLCSKLDTDAIADGGFSVIADFCNGAGARAGEKLAERLGIKMIAINKDPSGILPHDPEPRPRSALQVHSVLKPLKADIGFVFNSDMSRTSIVTSSGETLSEEYTIALVADQLLKKEQKVVTNWCTTKTLDEVAARHKANVYKTKVGEAFIIDRMLELGAELAGDGSGSAAFGGHIPGYDNFMVMGVILEAMAKKKATSAELAAALPRYHLVKRSIRTSSSHAYTMLHNLRGHFPDAEVNDEDGLRFDWPEGWIHLRASTTEPIVRMIVEWNSKEQAEDRALQVRGLLERLVV